jgi:hypothetical protein
MGVSRQKVKSVYSHGGGGEVDREPTVRPLAADRLGNLAPDGVGPDIAASMTEKTPPNRIDIDPDSRPNRRR